VRALRRAVTFILVSFAWIFFRANSLGDAITIISRLFSTPINISETLTSLGLSWVNILLIIFAIAVLFLLDNMITYEEKDGSDAVILGGSFIYIIWIVLTVWLLLYSKDMISSFIYFAF
jgi:D-alanyl-lipoteichoic acid acyltransferase DltB (MBOAT superfamily)